MLQPHLLPVPQAGFEPAQDRGFEPPAYAILLQGQALSILVGG